MTSVKSASVVVLVQARMGSQRLPGKSLKAFGGRPMILSVMERAAAMGFETWLATSEDGRDDLLASTVSRAGYHVWRGSEADVLRRMSEAARMARAEVVVRVTGDCPLLAPDVGRLVVGAFLAYGGDRYVSNDTSASGWPDGTDVEVFPAALLHRANETAHAMDHHDRQHVTPWVRRHAQAVTVSCPEDWRDVKLSVDTAQDFERVHAVWRRVGAGAMEWPVTRAALFNLGYRPR